MQSSAQSSEYGHGSSSVVVNMNSMFGSKSMTIVGSDTTSWFFLVFALIMGYCMGSASTSTSSSLGSIGRATWKGIALFEETVREIIVPAYTLGVLLYLSVRFYGDALNSGGEKKSKLLTILHSSLSSLPPALTRLSTRTITEDEAESTPTDDEIEEDEGEKPIEMTGVFKVVENDNFGEFLKAQGVPWFLCNAASKARPTHHFTHSSSKKLTIKIRGIIESETSYQIGGPHTETSIRGRVFKDSLSYLYDDSEVMGDDQCCVGVATRKIAVGEGYEVQVQRRIIRAGKIWTPGPEQNPDGHCLYDLGTPCDFDRLLMTNKVVYDGDSEGVKSIIASQMFHRID